MTLAPETSDGLDLARLGPWLAERVEVEESELRSRVIAGGKSNLTFEVADGRRRWIARRPPLGHVLATAHDMRREYRVMDALHDSAVPVPEMIAFCDDETVLGVPFYVMEFVDGMSYRSRGELEELGAERARDISDHLISVLAGIHAVDPVAMGLGDFGRSDGYLTRQVGRWRRQMDASHSRELVGAGELHRRLDAGVTEAEGSAPTATIVHGDFRLDNLLFTRGVDGADRAAAVIDWEMSTLGDPLSDLATLVAYQHAAELGFGGQIGDASLAEGWLSPSEVIDAYARHSERELSSIDFHLALAAYKLAAIAEGIHFRYHAGQTVGDGFEGIGELSEPMIAFGLTLLDASPT